MNARLWVDSVGSLIWSDPSLSPTSMHDQFPGGLYHFTLDRSVSHLPKIAYMIAYSRSYKKSPPVQINFEVTGLPNSPVYYSFETLPEFKEIQKVMISDIVPRYPTRFTIPVVGHATHDAQCDPTAAVTYSLLEPSDPGLTII